MTTDPTPIPEQPTAPRTADSDSQPMQEIGCPHGAWGMTVKCPYCGMPRTVSPSQHVSDRFLREVENGEREWPEAEAAASVPAPEQEEAVRMRIIETLHRWECDEEPPGHSYREHLPEDEPVVHPNRIDALVDLFAALATPSPVPAAPGLDVERLTEAMDFDRVEAQAIIEKYGFVFTTRLDKPIEERTEAERWEGLAFTFYTMLLPSNRRSEKIITEYARLHPADPEEA